MRRVLQLSILALMIAAVPTFAGIGIHVNLDQTKIEAENTTFTFPGDPGGYSASTLERTESGAPMGIGVDLTLNFLPILDFQLSAELAYAAYDVTFTPAPESGQSVVSEEGIPYLRAGADLSVLYNVYKNPIARIFVGAGPSLGVFAPIFSEALLLDNISSADDEVKPEDLVAAEFKFGFHGMLGLGIKPPAFPIGFRVYAKYYMMSGVEAPGPESWMTIGAGIFIGG